MKRVARSALALILGFVVTLGAVAVSHRVITGQSPGAHLGQPDRTRYCRRLLGSTGQPITPRGSAVDWLCVGYPDNFAITRPIDMAAACEETYGAPAYAIVADRQDPYSWECIRG